MNRISITKKQVRLINLLRTEESLISKILIHKTTPKILEHSRYNLWKIHKILSIGSDKSTRFIQFDIEFYPSISKELLPKTLNHARNYVDITDEIIDIVLTCRKSILIDNKKKTG